MIFRNVNASIITRNFHLLWAPRNSRHVIVAIWPNALQTRRGELVYWAASGFLHWGSDISMFPLHINGMGSVLDLFASWQMANAKRLFWSLKAYVPSNITRFGISFNWVAWMAFMFNQININLPKNMTWNTMRKIFPNMCKFNG